MRISSRNLDNFKKTVDNFKPKIIVGSKDEKGESQVTFCKKCSQPIFGHLNAGFPHKTNNEFQYCTMSCLKVITKLFIDY